MTPEVIPPRVPPFSWVDLGLPSGTIWLDRLVGAQTPYSAGLYYQWGSVNGHTASDGYSFDATTYSEQGLDTINSDLSESQDAARAFYGPSAKMPTVEQAQELIQYTSGQVIQNNVIKLTSLINGNSIILAMCGYIKDSSLIDGNSFQAWLSHYVDSSHASTLMRRDSILSVSSFIYRRYWGICVMAVHS